MNMKKNFLTMLLALALWQTVSDTFANKAASGGNVVSENTIAVHEQTDAYIAMPQLPYLPDAELAAKYEERYQKFRKIYPAVKGLFRELA
jgi:sugar (pentulose or hexulose) kinase